MTGRIAEGSFLGHEGVVTGLDVHMRKLSRRGDDHFGLWRDVYGLDSENVVDEGFEHALRVRLVNRRVARALMRMRESPLSDGRVDEFARPFATQLVDCFPAVDERNERWWAVTKPNPTGHRVVAGSFATIDAVNVVVCALHLMALAARSPRYVLLPGLADETKLLIRPSVELLAPRDSDFYDAYSPLFLTLDGLATVRFVPDAKNITKTRREMVAAALAMLSRLCRDPLPDEFVRRAADAAAATPGGGGPTCFDDALAALLAVRNGNRWCSASREVTPPVACTVDACRCAGVTAIILAR